MTLSRLESARNPARKPDFPPGSTIAQVRVQCSGLCPATPFGTIPSTQVFEDSRTNKWFTEILWPSYASWLQDTRTMTPMQSQGGFEKPHGMTLKLVYRAENRCKSNGPRPGPFPNPLGPGWAGVFGQFGDSFSWAPEGCPDGPPPRPLRAGIATQTGQFRGQLAVLGAVLGPARPAWSNSRSPKPDIDCYKGPDRAER